jgi:hypothetical protein
MGRERHFPMNCGGIVISDAPWFKTSPMNAEMELFLKRLGGRVVATEGDADEVAKLWPLKVEVQVSLI